MMVRLRALACLCSLATSACFVGRYVPPTTAEPHAVLKFRRVYEKTRGTSLSERLVVGGRVAYAGTLPSAEVGDARTDGLLVHPGAIDVSAEGTFSHAESRRVSETYQVQVPYTTMETYSCGSGGTYRTCSRAATHYRSETRQRMVTRTVTHTDGRCAAASYLKARAGSMYLLEFDYRDDGSCTLLCFETTSDEATGVMRQRRCTGADDAGREGAPQALRGEADRE